MSDVPDAELLEQFARNHSEAAFAGLVSRYVGLVYSTALRKTENPQHAEDITQAVFIIMARKAGSLGPKTVLPGWLYHTTRLTAANLQRAEIRRIRREQEVYMQSTMKEPAPDAFWRELSPMLEDAMAGLGASDRDAIVLRFFQNHNLAEVGAALGIAERAAQKRVDRALEKLRKFFARRGVALTTAIIAGAISSHSVQAAPAALANSATAIALAKGATASASTLTLVKGALKIMAWTKTKTAMVAGVVILLAAGVTTHVVMETRKTSASDSWRSITNFYSQSAMEADLKKTPPQVTILPTIHTHWGATWWIDRTSRMLGMNSSVADLLEDAYGVRSTKTVYLEQPPAGQYDFIANLPGGSRAALQQKIKEQFGLTAHKEIRNTQVWVLAISDTEKLKKIVNHNGHSVRDFSYGKLKMGNIGMPRLADALEGLFVFAPVIDRTGAHGRYDFTLQWDVHSESTRISMITNELNNAGLNLTSTNMPMEMLVVEKANPENP